MKKLLSLLLALAMLMSLSPLTFAADASYGANIALGKRVDYPGAWTGNYVPQNLTDGNLATTAACNTSQDIMIGGTGMWMVVDLGGLYELERVILHTRHDLDAEWARKGLGVAYGVEPDYSDMIELGRKPGAGDFKSTLNVKVSDAPVARYVAMFCFAAGAGNVAGELEVFGSPYSGEGTGDFEDVDTPAQKNAVKLLYNLGIMEGVSKTEFGINNLITRAEGAKIICKVAGLPEPAGYRDEFVDVTADNPYAPYIQAGVDYGFISKDSHFRPDDYLLGYELLKMILCVNGHNQKPTNTTVYPAKILQIAKDLELLKDSNTDGWSHVGKASAAVILYNAFLSNTFVHKNDRYVETDETLLEDAFGYVLKTGIVTSNHVTRLDGRQDAYSPNHIGIGGQSFNDLSGLGKDFIGETVYYLVDEENGDVVTLWADDEENNTITVKTEDIAPSSTLTSLEVYKSKDSSKVIRHKIKKNAFRLRNDVADVDLTAADFLPSANPNGYVTLLDYDDDGVYDVIKVYKPEIVVVDTVYNDTYSTALSISEATGARYEYDYDYIEVTTAEGKTAAVDNLGQGSLIYLYANGPIVNIQIMPASFEGVATTTSKGEYVGIDGTIYEMTTYFARNYESAVEIGKSATFYTDLDNRLVAVTEVDTRANSQVIAIVQKFYVNPDRDESLVKLYDETGTFHELTIEKSLVHNGTRKTLAQLTTGQFVGEPVYATIGEDNILKVISTGDESLLESGVSAKGYSTGNAVYDKHTFKCVVNPDAPVFTIPIDIDTGFPITSSDFTGLYSVKKMSDVFGRVGAEMTTEYAVCGMDEYMSPTFLMRKVEYDLASKTFEPCNNVLHEKTACVVDTVRQNVDEYGDLSYTITGYAIDSGKTVKFTTAAGLEQAVNYAKLSTRDDFPVITKYGNDGVNYLYNHRGVDKGGFVALDKYTDYLTPILSLKKGDIVRYCFDGETYVKEIDLIASKADFVGDNKVIYTVGNDPVKILSTLRLQRTVVKDIKEGYILFDVYDTASSATVTESIKLSAFTGNIIVIQDGKIEAYPMSSAGVVLKQGDKILVHTSESKHVSIICLKD